MPSLSRASAAPPHPPALPVPSLSAVLLKLFFCGGHFSLRAGYPASLIPGEILVCCFLGSRKPGGLGPSGMGNRAKGG